MIFPAVLSGFLCMSFVLCFNCFSIQYYLAPFGTYTLPMLIYTKIPRSADNPDINAIATLLTIAIAVVIFIMNRVGFDAGQLVGQGHKEK